METADKIVDWMENWLPGLLFNGLRCLAMIVWVLVLAGAWCVMPPRRFRAWGSVPRWLQ